jgi:hypothetical protein
MNDWPTRGRLTEFYGNPVNRRDPSKPSQQWESLALVRVIIPWRAVAAWNTSLVLKSLRVHLKCKESLSRVFARIWEASGQDQAKIEEWGCHLIGGAYEYRATRGGSRLSTHAYGCAIDLDPARNKHGDSTPNFAEILEVQDAFAAEGWQWGGGWPRPDGMHWEAVR